MSTELVKAEVWLCPGMNCTGRTLIKDTLCGVCWDYRSVLHHRIGIGWHAAHDYLPPSVRHAERVTGGAGPSSRAPVNGPVLDAIETTLVVIVGWASVVRELAGLSVMPGLGTARPSWLFDQAMPALARHDHLLSDLRTIDYYGDLFRVTKTLVRLTHEEIRETENLGVACPACGRMSVVAREYGDCVACLTCGSQWGQSAWHAQLSM